MSETGDVNFTPGGWTQTGEAVQLASLAVCHLMKSSKGRA